jgi:hypothetical protein
MTMKTRTIVAIALGLTAASLTALPLAAQAQTHPTDYNYVGAGVAIGDLGNSDVGLSINSKITIKDHLSVRPGVMSNLNFNEAGETVFLLPVTYDFSPITNNGRLLPFVGAGLSISTEGAGAVGPLVNGGLDYRITDRVVANGTVNWSIYGNSQVNGSIGLGYSF